MSTLQVTFNGRIFTFAPGTIVRIGRSSENDIVVNEPTVSRRHARLTFEPSGWVWQNSGQAPTFLASQPVAQFAVGQQVDVRLGSPNGPALLLATATTHDDGAAPADAAASADPQGYAGGVTAQDYRAQRNAAAAQQDVAGGAPGALGVPGYPGHAGLRGGPAVPGQAGIPLSQLDMGSFFEILLPVKSWLHDRGWRQGIRLLIIPYALLPLIFLQVFSSSTSLSSPGWAYSLYVAPLWLLTFWYLIRPPVIGKLEVVIGIGIVIWTIVWLHVVTIHINEHFANTHNFVGSLVVGYNEETTKALPVLIAAILLLKIRKQKLDPRTWFLMGTVAGLTFGVVEQSIYTPLAIGQIANAHVVSQADIGALSFAFRVFVDGFQHAVWAGVSGFFVGIAVNYRRRRIPLLLLGISIPAILHALNDYTLTVFSTVWVGVLIQALSLLLFLGYTLSASAIERRVRRNPNFRGQSIMMERFSQPEQAPSP
jgi:RsiW-degrading membrane proteinase PrsW (M82 family)